jgi:opacity protein-like surface antigen
MKTGKMILAMTVFAALCSVITPARADDKKNSNIGLKLNLGLGSQDVPSSLDLENGEAVSLSLGYGVSQRVTLWLGMNGSNHVHELDKDRESKIVGVELGMQYKFRPHEKFRPYGKLGIGTYFLSREDGTGTILNGGGVAWALGAEYRLTSFFSVGAEFFWKDFDYTKQGTDGADGDFTDLPDPITGNTKGILINFTLH